MPRTVALLICLMTAVAATPVHAADIDIELVGQVLEGSEPSLVLHVNRATRELRVRLTAEGQKPLTVRTANLAPGDAYRVSLPAKIGATAYAGSIDATYRDGDKEQLNIDFEVQVVAVLELDIPDKRIDLEEHRLQLSMSKPADRCEYEVLFDGGPADVGIARFAEDPPGTWLTVPWKPCTAADCVVLKIRLHCFDVRGVERGVELFPWWLEIPHEEVVFASGSANLASTEAPKLDRAYEEIAKAVRRYGKIISIKLYVAGHTDTVGEAAVNQELSLERARTLARALRKRGLRAPVLYAGYGEQHLAVATADEVDEQRNRRARYILAVTPPEAGDWRPLK